MLVHIKGAGDIASGVAFRLRRAGFDIVMSELQTPTAIRRTVSFSSAVFDGRASVEDAEAVLVNDASSALDVISQGRIAIFAGESASNIKHMPVRAMVDATISKRNTGTRMSDAEVVIALGPGFRAGEDCHAVVETMRGHTLGRVYYSGRAIENTGEPGNIGGYTRERVIYAPESGEFITDRNIGDIVSAGDEIARVGDSVICAQISGVIRGLFPSGFIVKKGMKSGDIDPRGVVEHCFSPSDKAMAIAGGVLEALCRLLKLAQY